MTTRYTDPEWTTIISNIEREISASREENSRVDHHHAVVVKYSCPAPGSKAFARTIDHTLLKVESTGAQIDGLCAEARVGGFATVCVRPNFVAQAASDLKGSEVKIATVIGFHEGTADLAEKLHETIQAINHGAAELDVVINWPQLKAGQYDTIYTELAALRAAAAAPSNSILLKLILETSQLSRHDIVAGCVIACYAAFDYVKTSTGFVGHGARVEDMRVMRAVCDVLGQQGLKQMKVKASGGIRTLEDAVDMLEAGASRLGTSGGVWIVKEGVESREYHREKESGNKPPGLVTRLFTDY